tara:strand:- start:1282 stop:1887 length:606 start_codon:yes stop_codon:yes gene_type:complete
LTVVFGGTFDPVHIGHLHAANVAADILDASILMVLSARPVHREAPVASVEDRWRMLKAACANVERLVPSDIELERKGPSYAIETLVSLNASHHDPVIWVLGADAFDSVHTWYRFDEFVNRCSFLVFTRAGSSSNQLPSGFKKVNELSVLTGSSGVVYFGNQVMKQISATKLRQDMAQGCADENLFPSGVWEYARRRGLYLT